jgi:undecaprenyl-diphosphatase
LKSLLSAPKLVAVFLVANGIILLGVEWLTNRSRTRASHPQDDSRIARLSWASSIKIGCAQCLALVPGFSRTGATLGGGLLVGLDHEDAVRFSFLLATPIIFAAAVLKLPELFTDRALALGPLAVGFASSAVAAYFSVRFLTRYFKTKTLIPFAVYCVAFGGALLVLFMLR